MMAEENAMKANRTLIALNALLAAVLACNLPSSQRPVQAPTDQADVAVEASDTPAFTATPQFTETPSLTPTITLTPTPTVPQVGVTSATNCRTGPGTEYDLLLTLQPGQVVEVIAKYPPDNYWIIKMPSGGICWLWGQYAVVSGNTAVLPEYAPPPTPTPSLPANPSRLTVDVTCKLVKKGSGPIFLLVNEVHAEINWHDNASNEDGYRVWRDDTLIGDLSPNTEGIEDDTTLPGLVLSGSPTPSLTYTVQAYNTAGKSKKIWETVDCG
jgi:hypothetical protein